MNPFIILALGFLPLILMDLYCVYLGYPEKYQRGVKDGKRIS